MKTHLDKSVNEPLREISNNVVEIIWREPVRRLFPQYFHEVILGISHRIRVLQFVYFILSSEINVLHILCAFVRKKI